MLRWIFPYLLCGGLIGSFCAVAIAQCTLSATSSGGNVSYTQVYVLADASGQIVAENNTGSFANVAPGIYQIHALNYDPANPPAPLPAALIGQSISQVGTVTEGCYNSDFLTDYVVRVCNSCQRTTSLCETDPLTVSSSGSAVGFTQMYVLVNAASGMVVATNGTGIFTGAVAAGNSYQVHALNYSPSDPPNPLPIVGQAVTAIGGTDAGCYNSDFLSDYICFNITTCNPPCAKSIEVCPATHNIVATASGSNASYTQVYVLADASGNFVAQNGSGVFTATGLTPGGDYRVHALNFNPSDAPSALPGTWAAGTPLSSLQDGCFNNDFLSDYVCVRITCPIVMEQDELELVGEQQGEDNLLRWQHPAGWEAASYTLERSVNALSFEAVHSQTPDGSTEYTFWDRHAPVLAYYRVGATRKDGTGVYSKTIALAHSPVQATALHLYPNPTTGAVTVAFELEEAQLYGLEVWDMLGRVLEVQQEAGQTGANRPVLALGKYGSGVYIVVLKMEGTGEQIARKVVVQVP